MKKQKIKEVSRFTNILTFKGFTPGDKIKKIGVLALDSSNDFAKSTLLASTYFDPSCSSMNALINYKSITKNLITI